MSKVLLRHSNLIYYSCSCRRRYFAQSAYAHRSPIENDNPRTPEDGTILTTDLIGEGDVDPESSSTQTISSAKRDTTLTPAGDVAANQKSSRHTKVDIYLASLHSAGLHPTLSDLERCRPRYHAHPSSPQYARQYNELMDYLCRSFSKDQLRNFGILYNLDSLWTRPNRRKVEYAQAIIEKKWLWLCLKEIERKQRDQTEVLTQTFTMTPSQLFLILGKDGSDLLQLSIEFNVHISLISEPLSLKIEGLRGSLKLLTERISNLKKSIIEDTFQLSSSSPLPQNYIQRISRLSGAFIENLGSHGKVRIGALDAHTCSIAKRLANRAIHHMDESARVPLLSYVPTNAPVSTLGPGSLLPHSYSLYPFLSHRPLPWTIGTGGVFRVRRVAEWLGQEPCEDIRRTGGLAIGAGKILTLGQDTTGLKQTLMGAMSEGPVDAIKTVTASTGHILFSNPGVSQRASLVPPLKGHWPYSKILKWAETTDVQVSFVPSLPVPLLDTATVPQMFLHRLIYYKATGSDAPRSFKSFASPTSILKFEFLLAQQNPTAPQDLSDSQKSRSYDLTSAPQCWVGAQAEVGLMMPDRPMDMRLLVEELSAVDQGSEPAELREYFNGLHLFLNQQNTATEQPEPPVKFTFDNDIYELNSSTSVRQSTHVVAGVDTTNFLRSTHAKRESVLDLESNQKYMVCQVQCTDPESDKDWSEFMADCDNLTSFTKYSMNPSKSLGLGSIDDLQ